MPETMTSSKQTCVQCEMTDMVNATDGLMRSTFGAIALFLGDKCDAVNYHRAMRCFGQTASDFFFSFCNARMVKHSIQCK